MLISRRELVTALAAAPLLANLRAEQLRAEQEAAPPRALVVGIDRYRRIRPLTRAVNDARAMAARLEAIGFTTRQLIDPDGSELNDVFEAFVDQVPGSPSCLLYFAGHGLQAGGTNFLLGADATVDDVDRLALNALDLNSALAGLARQEIPLNIVILDACRTAPAEALPAAVSASVASTRAPPKFSMIFSAGFGQTARDSLGDGDGSPNSVFTRTLLPALDANRSLRDIVRRTRAEVGRIVARIPHDQTVSAYSQADEVLNVLGRPVGYAEAVPMVAMPVDPSTRYLSFFGLPPCWARERGWLDDLPGAAADARLVADVLQSVGFSGSHFDGGMMFDLEAALTDLAESDAETVIFYYSGFGLRLDGEAALIADAGPGDLPRPLPRSVRLGDILNMLLTRPTRKVVLLIDTNVMARIEFPSQLDGSPFVPRPDGLPIERVLGRWTPETLRRHDVGIYLASTSGFIADLLPGERHGAFALALSNLIVRPDLDLMELGDVLQREVLRLSTAAPVAGIEPQQIGQLVTASAARLKLVKPLAAIENADGYAVRNRRAQVCGPLLRPPIS